jgi:hypothetical protein
VQTRLFKFGKIFLVFMLTALVTNVVMEIVIPTPEKGRIISKHGWGHYLIVDVRGIVLFFVLFSLTGSVIYNTTSLMSADMGVASLVIGFLLEFAFMRPDWVLHVLTLKPRPGDLVAIIVSMFYWYIAWGLPSYIVWRLLMGLEK